MMLIKTKTRRIFNTVMPPFIPSTVCNSSFNKSLSKYKCTQRDFIQIHQHAQSQAGRNGIWKRLRIKVLTEERTKVMWSCIIPTSTCNDLWCCSKIFFFGKHIICNYIILYLKIILLYLYYIYHYLFIHLFKIDNI